MNILQAYIDTHYHGSARAFTFAIQDDTGYPSYPLVKHVLIGRRSVSRKFAEHVHKATKGKVRKEKLMFE